MQYYEYTTIDHHRTHSSSSPNNLLSSSSTCFFPTPSFFAHPSLSKLTATAAPIISTAPPKLSTGGVVPQITLSTTSANTSCKYVKLVALPPFSLCKPSVSRNCNRKPNSPIIAINPHCSAVVGSVKCNEGCTRIITKDAIVAISEK